MSTEGKELVVALVNHATKVLNIDMAPFLESHVGAFDQSLAQLTNGEGETFEQYEVFKLFEAELETHFDTFVKQHGFTSAAECFKAIENAVATDKAQRKEQMEQMQAQLQTMQAQLVEKLQHSLRGDTASGGDDSDLMAMLPVMVLGAKPDDPAAAAAAAAAEPEPDPAEDDFSKQQREIRDAQERRQKAREAALRCVDQPAVDPATVALKAGPAAAEDKSAVIAAAAAAAMPLVLFSQPLGLEQLLLHTLSLAEYSTFSALMRLKAREMQARRTWQSGAAERRARATAIHARLAAPSAEDLSSTGL